MEYSKLMNRPLESVTIVNGNLVRFTFKEGEPFELACEGDCCSHSWMEHLTLPKGIRGASIIKVSESENATAWDDHICGEEVDWERPCGHDSLSIYHVIFITTKGKIILEYRNDSNGYYGGYLVNYP